LSETHSNPEQLYDALTRALVDNLNLQDALQPLRPRPEEAYARWRESHRLWPRDLERQRVISQALRLRPKLSVVVATYNSQEAHLRAAIESVLDQTFDNWELCIADDASTQPHVRRVLQEYAARDPRVRPVFRSENGHISRATNSAIEIARGEFVCLLDHDDTLNPDALFEVALLLNVHPDADFVYSDEDKLDDATGKFIDPYFKPDWCPDSFLSRMYTAHLGVYRRSLVEELGAMREGFEGSQDYDLVLRLVERTHRIHHIPKVLYHWRIHKASTASEMEAKPYAAQAAERAIAEAIERRGQPGRVMVPADCPGTYIVRYNIGRPGRAQVYVSVAPKGKQLDRCLQSILLNDGYGDFEVVLLPPDESASTREACTAWLARDIRIQLAEPQGHANSARWRNSLISDSTAEYVAFVDDVAEVVTPDWLTAFVEQAQRPTVGAVGPLVVGPEGNVRQAGLIIGGEHIVAPGHRSHPRLGLGYFSTLRSINNFSALPGACMMVRRESFLRVGGLDEQLTAGYRDVDLCLRLKHAGYDNVFLPHVVVCDRSSVAEESAKRDDREIEIMRLRWRPDDNEDPCYNPNLSLDTQTYVLRS
jgi:GT2 family glycosyltransferase